MNFKKSLTEEKFDEKDKESQHDDSPQNRMAIKTWSNTVLEYMKVLFNKIKGHEDEFILNLSTPLQRNALEILMHLQNTHYELESYEMLPYQQSVLTVDIYLEIERSRKKAEEQILAIEKAKAREMHELKKQLEKEENDKKKVSEKKTHTNVESVNNSQEKKELNLNEIKEILSSQLAEENIQSNSVKDNKDSNDSDSWSEFTRDEEINTKLFNLKWEWENIHNKVIFDAVNEALDGLRPYGLKGPPLPWSKQNRTLTYKNGHITQVPTIMETVQKKILAWARTYAGTMNFSELLREYKITYLEEDQLNQVREERLALMLASEIEENEPLWTDYEFEETSIKLDIADMILDKLFDETALLVENKGRLSCLHSDPDSDENHDEVQVITDIDE